MPNTPPTVTPKSPVAKNRPTFWVERENISWWWAPWEASSRAIALSSAPSRTTNAKRPARSPASSPAAMPRRRYAETTVSGLVAGNAEQVPPVVGELVQVVEGPGRPSEERRQEIPARREQQEQSEEQQRQGQQAPQRQDGTIAPSENLLHYASFSGSSPRFGIMGERPVS